MAIKENNDVKWQTHRKLAKREYMRKVSEWEEKYHSEDGKAQRLFTRDKKPVEPDYEKLKIEFEQKFCDLFGLQILISLYEQNMELIDEILREMRSFADKFPLNKVIIA